MNIRILHTYIIVLPSIILMGCGDPKSHKHEGEEQDVISAKQTDVAHEHDEDEIIFSPEQAEAAGVAIEKIGRADFTEVIEVTGYVMPAQGAEATVSAKVSGIVHLAQNKIYEGCRVNLGERLFDIATQMLGDGNPVAAAKAELEAARKDWDRAQKLIKDHIISKREYEAVRLRYETARSTSKSMGNGKNHLRVNAPTDGYIQEILVKNGDFVTAGQPLASITQKKILQLRADLPERAYKMLNCIESANFRLTYDSEQIYELKKMNGRLISKGQTANKGEAYLPVIFEFDNVGHIIPGSLAEVYLLGQTRQGVISIPKTALTEELGLYYVYIKKNDHGYEKRRVKTGATDGCRIEISEGLDEGDLMVAKGAIAVKLAANSNIIPDAHAGHNH